MWDISEKTIYSYLFALIVFTLLYVSGFLLPVSPYDRILLVILNFGLRLILFAYAVTRINSFIKRRYYTARAETLETA